MGLKFDRTVGSRLDFLSRGLTIACFKYFGTVTVRRDLFIIARILGPTTSKTWSKNCVGIMSCENVVGFNCLIMS